MKPIVINSFEDLALAIKLSEAQRQREKRARFAAMFSGPPMPLMPRKPYPMDYKRQATFIVTSDGTDGFMVARPFKPMQAYSADEMAALGFGIDFGALEDPRAFVKVQDSIVEVIPEAPYKHEATFIIETPELSGISVTRPFPNAKAKR